MRVYPNRNAIVDGYRQGRSIESLAREVYSTRIFVKKSKALDYVRCVIYEYVMKSEG